MTPYQRAIMTEREENEAIEREEITAREEITHTLTKQIRTATNVTLPAVRFGKSQIVYVPVTDVIQDEIGFGKPFDALMRALRESDCPFVENIRLQIAKSYSDSNATEIAQMRYEP